MDHWRGLRIAGHGREIAVDPAALAAAAMRPVLPRNAEVLIAAGFDPAGTVSEAEGRDWGDEDYAGLGEAAVLRHVELGRLSDDDVNLLLFWGSDAAPLVELALDYLHRNPFHATNGLTWSALLVNVTEAVCLPSLPQESTPLRLRYGARLAAVCAQARAMIAEGTADHAGAELHDCPARVLREAQSHLNRHRPPLTEAPWRGC